MIYQLWLFLNLENTLLLDKKLTWDFKRMLLFGILIKNNLFTDLNYIRFIFKVYAFLLINYILLLLADKMTKESLFGKLFQEKHFEEMLLEVIMYISSDFIIIETICLLLFKIYMLKYGLSIMLIKKLAQFLVL